MTKDDLKENIPKHGGLCQAPGCQKEKTHVFMRRIPDGEGHIGLTSLTREYKLCSQHYEEWRKQ